jgi:hypothetical protein
MRSGRAPRSFAFLLLLAAATGGCFALFTLDGYGPVQTPIEGSIGDAIDPGMDAGDAGPDAVQVTGKIVFVTGQEYSVGIGNQLSSVGAANSLCELAASKAGLSGTFLAWISDDRTPPRLPAFGDAGNDTTQIITTTQQIVAASYAELFDGGPRVAIAATEDASTVALAPQVGNDGECPDGGLVWTGFSVKPNDDPPHCGQWLSGASGQNGGAGRIAKAPIAWSYACNLACSFRAHLYCFQL